MKLVINCLILFFSFTIHPMVFEMKEKHGFICDLKNYPNLSNVRIVQSGNKEFKELWVNDLSETYINYHFFLLINNIKAQIIEDPKNEVLFLKRLGELKRFFFQQYPISRPSYYLQEFGRHIAILQEIQDKILKALNVSNMSLKEKVKILISADLIPSPISEESKKIIKERVFLTNYDLILPKENFNDLSDEELKASYYFLQIIPDKVLCEWYKYLPDELKKFDKSNITKYAIHHGFYCSQKFLNSNNGRLVNFF